MQSQQKHEGYEEIKSCTRRCGLVEAKREDICYKQTKESDAYQL